MRPRIILAALALFCWSTAAPAQQPMLDLLPHDAGAAIAVRNLKELKQKGEDLQKELKLRNDVKFTDLFDQLYRLLGLQGVVDEDNSAAFLVVSTKSIGEPPLKNFQDFEVLKLLVGVVPFKDRDAIGEKLGFKKGELKVKELQIGPQGKFGGFHAYVNGNHLYLGMHGKAVEYAATTKKRFGEVLSASQRKNFGQADVIVEVGAWAWEKAWEDVILKEARRVLGEDADAKEKEMAEKIVKSMEAVRFGLAGLRLQKEGLHFSLMSAWEGDNKHVKEILGLLRYTETPTDLTGLPEGNVLLASAAKGKGTANAMLARVLFKAALQQLLGTPDITSPAERPQIVGVFNEIWYNLLGNRTALYQNADAKKHGALTMVSILDTADGQQFYDHMAHLAKIAHGKNLKLGKNGAVDPEKLVQDLNSDDHRQQELAKLKLRLLGAPALPAWKHRPYTNAQAKALRDEITKLAAERKKELPADNWFRNLRPTLEPLDKTEDRKGIKVHQMKMHLPKQAQHLTGPMKDLFGPEWDNIRFAVHGKNVVVLWGSDTDLLDETLKNLKDKKPGLAASAFAKTFYQKSNADRRLELHLASAPLSALFAAGAAGLPAPAQHPMSSIGLSVTSDTLQVDVYVPLAEARLLTRLLGLN